MAKDKTEKQYEVLTGFNTKEARYEIGDKFKSSDLSAGDLKTLLDMGAVKEAE